MRTENVPARRTVPLALAAAMSLGAVARPALAQTDVELAKLVASDGDDLDAFGSAVAIDAETAVLGAKWDSSITHRNGAAYVFEWDGVDWVEQQKLVASDASSGFGAEFGSAVAISADTIVIGAHLDDLPNGAAYVFERTGGAWVERQKILAPPGSMPNGFGFAVAVDGDRIVASCPGCDDPGLGAGSASGTVGVFARSAGTWTFESLLVPDDLAPGDLLGASVAIDGDRVVVGAIAHTETALGSIGAAYVFQRTGGGWRQQTQLVPTSTPELTQTFGYVDVDGDVVVVGDPFGEGAAPGSGAAYVFERTGAGWVEVDRLLASDGNVADEFGGSVAVDRNSIVVGASHDDLQPFLNAGSAYHFVRDGSFWSERSKLVASDTGGNDELGTSVAVSRGRTLIGAPFEDDVATDAGAVYAFDTSACLGTRYCDATPNSSGRPAFLCASGSPVVAQNDLTLDVLDVPGGVLGYFFAGPDPTQVPFGDGVQCVTGPQGVQRFYPAQRVDGFGYAELPVDLSTGTIAAGTTLHFQFCFRDRLGVAGFNLSDALTIAFQ